MYFRKHISLFIFLVILTLGACDTTQNKEKLHSETKKDLNANFKKAKIEIKGMTCEIGCARLIQSKLYKTEGVKFAKISFEDNNGIIEFDKNKVSKEKLIGVIQNIGGGDLYKVLSFSIINE